MTGHIYLITEQNVDGCGSDASEYVSSPILLSDEQLDALRNILQSVKQHAALSTECLDTSDMIQAALKGFNGKYGTSLSVCPSPVTAVINF